MRKGFNNNKVNKTTMFKKIKRIFSTDEIKWVKNITTDTIYLQIGECLYVKSSKEGEMLFTPDQVKNYLNKIKKDVIYITSFFYGI